MRAAFAGRCGVTLAEQIDRDLVDALKQHNRTKVSTLRLLKAAVKNAEVAKRGSVTDDEYQDVIRRQIKMRREAATEYKRAGRTDSADQEEAESKILEAYLPAQMDDGSIRSVLENAIAQTEARGPGDLGKVMSRAMPALRGKADGARVNQMARDLLQQGQ